MKFHRTGFALAPAMRRGALGVAMVIAGTANSHSVFACGYEDPSSAVFQRSVLSLSYPKALYVLGALTQARMDGTIAPEPIATANYLLGFIKTSHMLQRFGAALQIRSGDDEELAFTLVLIEPMLWTRFSIHEGHVATTVHVEGPQPGDLVVVTAEAVLRLIVDRRMTAERAEELGLIRIYGDPSKFDRLQRSFELRGSEQD
ncbi:hypothetical protein SAMN05519103_09083 [Rhizobiales bacterium GAS113]|nr:hypothetical protein SAMN05519103_09083 [Rhizobiales bacterium GAS113]